MFNIGPAELIVILLVALLIVGPKRLPEVGRSVGKALREIRRQTDEVRSSFEATINTDLDDDDDGQVDRPDGLRDRRHGVGRRGRRRRGGDGPGRGPEAPTEPIETSAATAASRRPGRGLPAPLGAGRADGRPGARRAVRAAEATDPPPGDQA